MVVNVRRGYFDVYVGRASSFSPKTVAGSDGRFGNPILVGEYCRACQGYHSTGGATLGCYEKYLRGKLATDESFKADVIGLKGKVLGCWCFPQPCHADILLKVVDELTGATT
jgi:hypothetical protein